MKTTCLENAEIAWSETGPPRSTRYDDIYFSSGDAAAESTHVFLAGNRLRERFSSLTSSPLVIGETGFGFGLNFLLTWELFNDSAPANTCLHYLSCELHPVRKQDLIRFYNTLPERLGPLHAQLLDGYPEQTGGIHRLHFSHGGKRIILDLLYDDALAALESLCLPGISGKGPSPSAPAIDAWFLDGFSPQGNTVMWNEKLCKRMAALSRPGATLATYSAAGHLRRDLQAAGFNVSRCAGFGAKRHMLTGVMEATPPESMLRPSWANPWQAPESEIHTVAVIGAGLAGCSTAHALAEKGYEVTLIEQEERVAARTSGNRLGIVHFNPARQIIPGAHFRLQAFLHAVRHYRTLSRQHDFQWRQCGLLQLALSVQERRFQEDLLARNLYDPSLFRHCTSEEASAIANIPLTHGGLHLPAAGSLDPVGLCRAYSSHPGISLLTGCRVKTFRRERHGWLIETEKSGHREIHHADAMVICTNADPALFPELPPYPIIANHGQVESFPRGAISGRLKAILCHQGYVIPARGTDECLAAGGSFAQGRRHGSGVAELRQKNLALLKKLSADIAKDADNAADRMTSRLGTRCTTPDYLPLAGPVEHREVCRSLLAPLKRNARVALQATPEYLPHLYLNVAHGSSGLSATPLIAEYLASLINREVLPLTDQQIQAIHPLRFLVRDLKRQK